MKALKLFFESLNIGFKEIELRLHLKSIMDSINMKSILSFKIS